MVVNKDSPENHRVSGSDDSAGDQLVPSVPAHTVFHLVTFALGVVFLSVSAVTLYISDALTSCGCDGARDG